MAPTDAGKEVRVLHLAGSPVSEEFARLSRLYARDALEATASALIDGRSQRQMLAHVDPGGAWRFPDGLSEADLAAAAPMPVVKAIEHLGGLGVDVMVPHLFCLPGMTLYRGLFDLLGVPYVGNEPHVMALGADKVQAKAVVAAAGVATPEWQVVTQAEQATLAPPVVVKPVDSDNSWGVSLVRDRADYPAAVTEAMRHGRAALMETFVPLGREVRCGVVERDGELLCLPLEEYAVDAETKPVRDAADKLADADDGDLRLVAKDDAHAWLVEESDPATTVVHEAARACHRALGCRHYSLFDFRLDPDGRPWFLEAGLYCSFARQSVVAVMAAAAGIDVGDLFAGAVLSAVRPKEPPCT